MAFNNIGRYYLAAGASTRVTIEYRRPGDMGAQWIMAHPPRGEMPTDLEVTQFTKELHYGEILANTSGGYFPNFDTYYYRYSATVRNRGSRGAYFSLSGGGNA